MKVTLADIAKKTGVTVSTVQRALNNGGGVSKEKRAIIQKVATELGYKKDFYTTKWSPRPLRVLVLLPETNKSASSYPDHLWLGIHRFIEKENAPYLEVVSIPFTWPPSTYLQAVVDGKYGKIDGIITRSLEDSENIPILNSLKEQKIPVVLIGTDVPLPQRLTSVLNYDKMAGGIASDLALNLCREKQSKVVVCGVLRAENQFNSALGFERALWESKRNIDVLKVLLTADTEATYRSIIEILESTPNIPFIYACSAQATVLCGNALRQLGLQDKIFMVGSDLFDKSVEMLLDGTIGTILYNRPSDMAYQAFQALLSYLINPNDPPPPHILINPDIVTKHNLDFYIQDIPFLQQYFNAENLVI